MGKISSVLQIVLPVIVMLLIGILARRKQWVSDQGVRDIKALLSNVCIPAVMFSTFYAAAFDSSAVILVLSMAAFTVAAWLLGFVFKRLLHIQQPLAPYLCTSIEGGMMGYALFILLFGQENLYYMALLDLGNAFVVFPFLLTKLRMRTETATSSRGVFRELLTPINLAIAGGLAVNFTGLGARLAASPFGPVLDAVLSFLSGPVTVLILLVVGHGLNFGDIQWGETFKTVLARAAVFAAFGAVLYRLLSLAYPGEPIVGYSVVMAFILPPTFMYSVTVKEAKEGAYVGAVLALYTLFSLAAFGVLAWVAAPA